MNAPDFNFGPERRERGLTVVGDRRDLVIGTYPTAGAAPAEPDGPKLRDQFFKILGLALKHRWLVLACCVGGLVIGFLVTFTSTPIYRATATIQVDLAAAKVVKLDTPDSSPQVELVSFLSNAKGAIAKSFFGRTGCQQFGSRRRRLRQPTANFVVGKTANASYFPTSQERNWIWRSAKPLRLV